MAKASRKYTSTSFTVDVDIDRWELLEALSDEDLIEEMKERELKVSDAQKDGIKERDDVLREILVCLCSREHEEARLIAERFVFAKFSSVKECEERLKELKASAVSGDRSQADATEVAR